MPPCVVSVSYEERFAVSKPIAKRACGSAPPLVGSSGKTLPLRVVAIVLSLMVFTGPTLAQATPETSDKPSAAASPAAPVKTGSERRREESAAEQGHPLPGTEMNSQSGQGRPAEQLPSSGQD